MPLFSPVFNDLFFDRELVEKAVATKNNCSWPNFLARRFPTQRKMAQLRATGIMELFM